MGTLDGKRFVIVGRTSRRRDELRDLICDEGGFVEEEVSNRTHFLIKGRDDSSGLLSKVERALKLGVKVISEGDLLVMVAGIFGSSLRERIGSVADFEGSRERLVREMTTEDAKRSVRRGMTMLEALRKVLR